MPATVELFGAGFVASVGSSEEPLVGRSDGTDSASISCYAGTINGTTDTFSRGAGSSSVIVTEEFAVSLNVVVV